MRVFVTGASGFIVKVVKKDGMEHLVGFYKDDPKQQKQVKGEIDVFSFGAILYEMLAGQRAFHGETQVDTMTAVLKEEPAEVNLERAAIPLAYRDVTGGRGERRRHAEELFQVRQRLLTALAASGVAGRPLAVPR